MRINLIITSLGVLSACSQQKQNDTENNKPNILFIAVDDLKPMLGCYGDTLIKTPNIDKLAERGMVFMNNHCQVAVSGASRACLLSGMYPDKIKVWTFEKMRNHKKDLISLPQHFKNNGYRTINIGKVFDYRTVDTYSDSLSWSSVFPVNEDDFTPFYNKSNGVPATYFYQSEYVKQKASEYKIEADKKGEDPIRYSLNRISPAVECIDVADDAYKDGVFANLAIEKINNESRQDKPFFLAVGFHKPHLPFVAPKKYWDLYNRNNIQIEKFQHHSENGINYSYHHSDELQRYSDETGNFIYDRLKDSSKILSLEEQKKLIHGYMACVSYVDAQIGKIVDALKEKGLYDNTIIVLWGDHGWHIGDHGMWGKATVFEQATRSPLIISSPGMKHKNILAATEFIDIYPTLCELSRLPLPEHIDGESLVPLIENENFNSVAYSQFIRKDRMGYAVRNERYRYIEWINKGFHIEPNADLTRVDAVELYDYEKDPLEKINVANTNEYKEIQKIMKEKISDFHKTYTK